MYCDPTLPKHPNLCDTTDRCSQILERLGRTSTVKFSHISRVKTDPEPGVVIRQPKMLALIVPTLHIYPDALWCLQKRDPLILERQQQQHMHAGECSKGECGEGG